MVVTALKPRCRGRSIIAALESASHLLMLGCAIRAIILTTCDTGTLKMSFDRDHGPTWTLDQTQQAVDALQALGVPLVCLSNGSRADTALCSVTPFVVQKGTCPHHSEVCSHLWSQAVRSVPRPQLARLGSLRQVSDDREGRTLVFASWLSVHSGLGLRHICSHLEAVRGVASH